MTIVNTSSVRVNLSPGETKKALADYLRRIDRWRPGTIIDAVCSGRDGCIWFTVSSSVKESFKENPEGPKDTKGAGP